MRQHEEIVIDSKPFPQPVTKKKTGSSPLFWPLLLITLGVLLLLNNLGILSWSIWNNLWRFWPLLLILVGLEMLLGKSRLTNVIITLIGLTLLLFVLTLNIPEIRIWLNQVLPHLNISQLQNLLASYTR